MKDEEILKLIRAFDEQQEVVKKLNDIIDRLCEILALHVSTQELEKITERVRLLRDEG